MSEPAVARPSLRLLALWYTLASTALIVVLAVRGFGGWWFADPLVLVRLALVPPVQAAAVAVAPAWLSAAAGPRVAGERGWLAPLLTLWALLAALAVVGALVVGLGMGTLDLRFAVFCELLVAPVAQAVVLSWVAGRWRLADGGRRVAEVVAEPLVASGLAVGLLASAAALATGRGLVLAGWVAALAVLAWAVVAVRGPWSAAERLRLGALTGWLAALGLEPFSPWMATTTSLLAPAWPTAVAWIAVALPLFAATLGVVIAGAAVVRRVSAASAWLLEMAGGVAFLVALGAVASTFLRRTPAPGWAAVLGGGVAVAAVLVLGGGLLVARSPSPEARPQRSAAMASRRTATSSIGRPFE